MQAIEFKTKIKNGMIPIPDKYRRTLRDNVKVIVLSEDNHSKQLNIIDNLMNTPLVIDNFQPIDRDNIYDRG